MELQVITGIIRVLLSAYGGILVQEGYLTDDQLQALIGGILVAIPLVWSALRNSKYFPKVKV